MLLMSTASSQALLLETAVLVFNMTSRNPGSTTVRLGINMTVTLIGVLLAYVSVCTFELATSKLEKGRAICVRQGNIWAHICWQRCSLQLIKFP